jgi:hypothetical protein
MSGANTYNRERLGWAFLLAGFAGFVAIAISIPLAVNAYLQNSKQPLPTSVQANQGTVRIDDKVGLLRATSVGEPPESVDSGSELLTDATATALVLIHPPDSDQILARMQVYGNTNVHLDRIDAPRFDVSASEQRIDLTMNSGRLSLTVPDVQDRPFSVRIVAPLADIASHEPGQYSVEVTNAQTQVAVQRGRAIVTAGAESLTLVSDQRATAAAEGGLIGPVDAERNLVVNGDFNELFDQWTQFSWTVELPEQPEGQVDIVRISGEPTLRILRQGQGHADIKLRQVINQDVTDYETIRLFLTFRIVNHDLGVCGVQGSECPIFVRLDYVDDNGVSRTWQHGFYSVGQIDPSLTPDACVSCAVAQSAHQSVQLGQVYFFEADVRADLARQGFLPLRLIESVSIVSSGHSFEVHIMDVALMAKE